MIVGATGVNKAGRARDIIRVRGVRKARGSDLHAAFEEVIYVGKAGIKL